MTDTSRWTTPADLLAQLERLWNKGRLLETALRGAADAPCAFPLALRLSRPDRGDLGDRFEQVRGWIRALEADAKTARGFGYEIVWDEFNHRQLGRNRIPRAVFVPTLEDALAWLGKRKAAERFDRLCQETRVRLPQLEPWLAGHALVALEQEAAWAQILAVLEWFRAHPRSGLYLRQLEIPGIDTKFIEARKALLAELLDHVLTADAIDPSASGARQFEQRYGLLGKPVLVRFRTLDRSLQVGPLTDVATPATQFARLDLPAERVFITENDINGLAFPDVPGSIVVFGLGYGLDRLSEIAWLQRAAIYYWGDLDTHGFAMLHRLRAALPSARSFLMDRATLLEHRPMWSREPLQHQGSLDRLTEVERALCDDLRRDRFGAAIRLEQERIGYAWLKHALSELAVKTGATS